MSAYGIPAMLAGRHGPISVVATPGQGLVVQAAALLVVLISWFVCFAANGHTVANFLPLEYQAYHAPFGFDGTETYTQLWATEDYAFLGSLSSGVAIIDIRDPAALTTISVFGAELDSSFHEVQVAGTTGYFSTSDAGTFIVDLSIPGDPRTIANVSSDLGGFNSVTNTFVYRDHLYQVSATSAEIAVIDVSFPLTPNYVTRLATGDVTGIYDLSVVDDHLYAAGLGGSAGEGAVYIYDIGNVYSEGGKLVAQIQTGENTASAWPSADRSKLLVSHRKAGGSLTAWDITDPTLPTMIESVDASDFAINAYSAGEIVVLGQLAYVAWYQAGLQVMDLNLLTLTDVIYRVGAFGTSQASPLDGLVGNQSVFPVNHDKVFLADSKWGLFLVDATNVLPQPDIPGDFNGDRQVDAGDYTVWRDSLGQTVLSYTGADADGDGEIGGQDFLVWKTMFFSGSGVEIMAGPVPEPTSIMMFTLLLGLSSIRHHGLCDQSDERNLANR